MTGLSPEALAIRAHRIGASELAQALGLSPYGGPFDVFARIVCNIQRADSPEFASGRRLERAVLDYYEETFGTILIRDPGPRVHPRLDFLSCTPDAETQTGCINVQAKTDRDRSAWGEPGTDQVPVHIAVQVQCEMAILECTITHVPVYFKGADSWETFIVPRDQAVIDHLERGAADFWNRHVIGGEMPPLDGGNAAASYLRKRYPGGAPLAVATPEQRAMVTAYSEQKATIKRLTSEADIMRQRIALELGDSNGWEGLCTFKPNKKGVRSLLLIAEKE